MQASLIDCSNTSVVAGDCLLRTRTYNDVDPIIDVLEEDDPNPFVVIDDEGDGDDDDDDDSEHCKNSSTVTGSRLLLLSFSLLLLLLSTCWSKYVTSAASSLGLRVLTSNFNTVVNWVLEDAEAEAADETKRGKKDIKGGSGRRGGEKR